ncbi:hypothetical protein FB45DRAFT_872054 [Roridomyces roridus]|uniref:F-box domain-containing protein n=1 Tax=Roridomyces roridus TaxID=1738132 RepID=A0AAD7BEC8_9AGAR|nr:hypothetical protein FB45DRAFT_872054 [Roridomyces roridus]
MTHPFARQRLVELDLEIERLRDSLDSLVSERKTIRGLLTDYKHPVLTLPSEITSEISPNLCPRTRHVPSLWVICLRWRDVAIATPGLWRAIALDLDFPEDHVHQRCLLHAWLKRSGNLPLTIQISCWDLNLPLVAFVEAIAEHASRWQEMEILRPYQHLLTFTGPMPLLPRFDPDCITLPWSQLTFLRAELSPGDAAAILRASRAQQKCTCGVKSGYNTPIAPIPPLLPLHSLMMDQMDSDDAETSDTMLRLLRALNLPALETVVIPEVFLGPDPIATLSGWRPSGYPTRIYISEARRAREFYEQVLPDVVDLKVWQNGIQVGP